MKSLYSGNMYFSFFSFPFIFSSFVLFHITFDSLVGLYLRAMKAKVTAILPTAVFQ